MKRNLKSFESQANISVILAGLAALGAVAAIYCVLSGFNWEFRMLTYNPNGMRFYALGAALCLTFGASVVGVCFGFNSAGQRRNKKSRLSWIGFFVNAALIALALMVAVFFLGFRNPMSPV